MKNISRKGDIQKEIQAALDVFDPRDTAFFMEELHTRILHAKVKFPLLEICGDRIFEETPDAFHLGICDAVASLATEGGNVIIGKMLQRRLAANFDESMKKAAEYIAAGEAWYATDIIGERVFGVAMLHFPERAFLYLEEFSRHENPWVVRSVGAGSHYAIKKGLSADWVKRIFGLLLFLARAKDYHIKTGIGWAAKTAAKFHPDVVRAYSAELENDQSTGKWFRTKVRIGLERNAHAKRN